jgi:metal-responsive CopG/Arc/MetJ family transcriptional regulator
MKTAIPLPDALYEAAELLAGRLGVSRSRLYANALEEYIGRHNARRVTERLNAIFGAEASSIDRAVAAAQTEVLKRSDW